MASSTSSEQIVGSYTKAANALRLCRPSPTSKQVRLHRSVNHLSFRWDDTLRGAGLCLLATFGWLLLLPWVCRLWQYMFQVGVRQLQLNATVVLRPYGIRSLHVGLPSIDMTSFPPDMATWWTTAIVCAVLLALSFTPPSRFTPFVYLLRFALVIQGSALIYFALIPARFPHGTTDFITSTVAGGSTLILLVPAIFGLIYYVFDFGIARKACLTLLAMSHLTVLVPLQALLQAYILRHSVLFMPLLFLLFGMPLEILAIVSFYSWAMSWRTQTRK